MTEAHLTVFLSLIESMFKVETKTIAADFGGTDIYSKIEAGLEGLEIGVLGEFTTHVQPPSRFLSRQPSFYSHAWHS